MCLPLRGPSCIYRGWVSHGVWKVGGRLVVWKYFPEFISQRLILFLALVDCVKADHGFNIDSRSIRNLLEVLSSLSLNDRRTFLQFLTGSPKLPIGGTFLFYIRSNFQASRSCSLPSRSFADLMNHHWLLTIIFRAWWPARIILNYPITPRKTSCVKRFSPRWPKAHSPSTYHRGKDWRIMFCISFLSYSCILLPKGCDARIRKGMKSCLL